MSLILLPSKIIKPATLSRRGFLRAMGVTATVITVPSLIVLEHRKALVHKISYINNGPYKREGIYTERKEEWFIEDREISEEAFSRLAKTGDYFTVGVIIG